VTHPASSDLAAAAPPKFKSAQRTRDRLDAKRPHHVTPHFGAKLREGTLCTCVYQMPSMSCPPECHLINCENQLNQLKTRQLILTCAWIRGTATRAPFYTPIVSPPGNGILTTTDGTRHAWRGLHSHNLLPTRQRCLAAFTTHYTVEKHRPNTVSGELRIPCTLSSYPLADPAMGPTTKGLYTTSYSPCSRATPNKPPDTAPDTQRALRSAYTTQPSRWTHCHDSHVVSMSYTSVCHSFMFCIRSNVGL